ncbi:MAG TPA: ATP-binding protein [Solirubrobacteraceae bacterium]
MRIPSRDLFPSDAPVPLDRMIGRRGDVDQLVLQLSGGAHRILAAPRRTGKSSVCEAAIGVLRAKHFYTVSVSLFKYTDAATLAEAIAQETLANRGPMHKLIEKIRETGAAVAKGAELALAMKTQADLGDAVELAIHPGYSARDPEQALRMALELPQRIAERDGKRLILFIDELQEIADSGGAYGDPDGLMGFMRETLHGSELVTALFAGSMEHMMRDLFTNRQRAFYGFGGFMELTPILAGEWRAGLLERFAEDDCTVEENALDRVIELGVLRPRAIMLIAQQAHLASIEADTHTIDLGLALSGWQSALQAERARHVDAVDAIRHMGRSGAVALRIAGNLANGRPAYHGIESQAASRALRHLQHSSIVHRTPQTGRWEIDDPLLATYIRNEIAT